ncbi:MULTISPECIES: hypothetical protein [Morganellaceae]|uniref:Uncharacterized protein n=1 Tax=Providencia rustigianii DSM 4541 TaxID=500637 RepID=D1P2H8_9GAMM|nr:MULTISPECIES: hypothetical protein [Morganellaceae]HEM7131353.1 hypothetical protein [Providencia rettgeri]EFB72333.1 hypothetical protein PROVRUST_06402 [Providencia rustigianii DSM 4541]MDF7217361.1 hypothetical protein [Proteus mirabilis]MDF7260012.1 hypothetical protein [Proteus mirabilis]MDF7296659.1 hypothetical protein [Proteus mirabilis]
MISIDVNDNYLECRQYYAVLFCMLSEKTLSLNELYKMTSEAKNKNVNVLFSELNQHVGHVFKNVDYYLRKIEQKIIPIEQLSFLTNDRISFVILNFLMKSYNKHLIENDYKSIMTGVYNYSPLNLIPVMGRDIPFHYIVCFLDFVVLFVNPKDFNKVVFFMRDEALSVFKEYPEPFSFLPRRTEALKWIAERMIRENISSDDDVNLLIENQKWKTIYSCFDYWAIISSVEKVKLFLSQTRKAWSQKKYRDGVKDKTVLNTYISKSSMLKLKKIAKKHNKNINEIIEAMINQIDLPLEPLEEFVLLTKKES